MKRPVARLALIIFVLVWLIALSFPFVAILLATNDEIAVGSDSGSHVRLFMVRSEEQKGIGLEWSRPVADQDCYQTTVRYLLWEGGDVDQNVEFCHCIDPASGSIEVQPLCD